MQFRLLREFYSDANDYKYIGIVSVICLWMNNENDILKKCEL